jgi:hypothetical protein
MLHGPQIDTGPEDGFDRPRATLKKVMCRKMSCFFYDYLENEKKIVRFSWLKRSALTRGSQWRKIHCDMLIYRGTMAVYIFFFFSEKKKDGNLLCNFFNLVKYRQG